MAKKVDRKKEMEGVGLYSPAEERLNVLTHGAGFLLSLVGWGLLLFHPDLNGDSIHTLYFGIFGGSLALLYGASTLYHNAKPGKRRYRLKILDHMAIYILIAGTYTPFSLITLRGPTGTAIFIAVWSVAVVGVVLKLFLSGKYNILFTLMYVGMGWIIILAINPLMESLPAGGLTWLFAGGAAYTLGAVIFSLERIKFNHAIFHVFVLTGSFCHFCAVYFYVLGQG